MIEIVDNVNVVISEFPGVVIDVSINPDSDVKFIELSVAYQGAKARKILAKEELTNGNMIESLRKLAENV